VPTGTTESKHKRPLLLHISFLTNITELLTNIPANRQITDRGKYIVAHPSKNPAEPPSHE